MPGILYLCATPIGNLKDVTYRVIETLQEVDLIAAEDTRHSIKLLNHYNIQTPMTSYHEHNKIEKAEALVHELQNGKNVALISDAGTPAISDPGEVLVRKCHEAGVKVTSLPGPCACITALTVSGMETRRFCFEAFLPPEKKMRKRILEELKKETRTIILYEAPHHLLQVLKDLIQALGEDRLVTVCRELTKRHEDLLCSDLKGALTFYQQNEPRGEFVLIIQGKSFAAVDKELADGWKEISITEHMQIYLDKGLDKKTAMKQVAKERGVTKREVYDAMLNRGV